MRLSGIARRATARERSQNAAMEKLFMWKRPTKAPPSAKQSIAPAPPRSEWHAVSIISNASCCPAAMGLLGTRFLSREAPRLPLKNCSMSAACRCSYQHHDDRRGSSRRTHDLWNPGHGSYGGKERRGERGRRVTDLK